MTRTLPAHPLPGYGQLTLAQWDALGEMEERCELVRGVLIMAASEMSTHRPVVASLLRHLGALPDLDSLPDMDVLIDPDPDRPTVRQPDLAVVGRWPGDVPRLDPADVLLVVEIVSRSSQEQDWVSKRDEYAAAGIPGYLVVDRHRGQIALFSRPEAGSYVECQVGTAVDVPLLDSTLRVDLHDLLPPEDAD